MNYVNNRELPLIHLYFHSARYLKPVQVWQRVWTLTQRRALDRFALYKKRYLRGLAEQEQVEFQLLPDDANRLYDVTCLESGNQGAVEALERGTFTFLNRQVNLGSPINWAPENETQLWRYNLHYFDYAQILAYEYACKGNDRAYQLFRKLVCEWISSCPLATPIAWDPYPVSLRLSNWIKVYGFFAPALASDDEFAIQLRRSLYVQAAFLEEHLEYSLMGNHLIENGRALLLAGLFFADPQAERWRTKGERILWEELAEQFLEDGGHYERSPMYHQILLELYQEVINVLQSQGYPVPDKFKERVQDMRAWLNTVLHPDGNIPLFNDAAFGITRSPVDLLADANPAPEGFTALPASGYFMFRDSLQQNFLIFDCGPLGPDYQPGHGHCDTLSYELSVAGQRMIVDSGVDDYYGDLAWRTYYRSTWAHNTIIVDRAEQSEIWGRFRLARRAHPLDLHWTNHESDPTYVGCSHTGYRRLKGNVVHRRWMCWIDRRFWLVCDYVAGQGRHHLESFIHFHPDVQIVKVPDFEGFDQAGQVKRDQVTLQIVPWNVQKVSCYHGETEPIQGWYSPEFGLQLENHVWGLNQLNELPIWMGYVLWPEDTDVSVEWSCVDRRGSHVVIQSDDISYHINCSAEGVAVRRDQL